MASSSGFPLIFPKLLVIVVGLLVIVGTVGLALGLVVEPTVRGCGGGTDSSISLKYIRSLLLRSSLCSWQDTAVSWVRSRGRTVGEVPMHCQIEQELDVWDEFGRRARKSGHVDCKVLASVAVVGIFEPPCCHFVGRSMKEVQEKSP